MRSIIGDVRDADAVRTAVYAAAPESVFHMAAQALEHDRFILKRSLHFMYYKLVRIHQTLRVTPAMAAGVTDTPWEIEDIARLAE